MVGGVGGCLYNIKIIIIGKSGEGWINEEGKLRYLYMYMYVHIKLQQPLACISTKDGWCVHVQSYMYMYRNTCICDHI